MKKYGTLKPEDTTDEFYPNIEPNENIPDETIELKKLVKELQDKINTIETKVDSSLLDIDASPNSIPLRDPNGALYSEDSDEQDQTGVVNNYMLYHKLETKLNKNESKLKLKASQDTEPSTMLEKTISNKVLFDRKNDQFYIENDGNRLRIRDKDGAVDNSIITLLKNEAGTQFNFKGDSSSIRMGYDKDGVDAGFELKTSVNGKNFSIKSNNSGGRDYPEIAWENYKLKFEETDGLIFKYVDETKAILRENSFSYKGVQVALIGDSDTVYSWDNHSISLLYNFDGIISFILGEDETYSGDTCTSCSFYFNPNVIPDYHTNITVSDNITFKITRNPNYVTLTLLNVQEYEQILGVKAIVKSQNV